jgi:hypothetical protein
LSGWIFSLRWWRSCLGALLWPEDRPTLLPGNSLLVRKSVPAAPAVTDFLQPGTEDLSNWLAYGFRLYHGPGSRTIFDACLKFGAGSRLAGNIII